MTQAPAQFIESHFDSTLETLKSLCRIPSISFDGFDPLIVEKSAETVAALMREKGLENVEILKIPGAHPYVYADWMHASGAPTLLLYAHHDVQPLGRRELWATPPFEPTVKDGPGGPRLFGRGTADDKAGILVHLAAIEAYLRTVGKLPVNVKVMIEGEEEIGSGHLPEFVEKYKSKLAADVMILTDTTNFDCGVPALTVALRGMVGVEVELRALTKAVHSGMWGGPLPDPAMALCKVLGELTDDQGKIAIPGVLEQVRPVTPEERARLEKVPHNDELFRTQAGVVSSAQLLKEGPSPTVQVWRFPSLTINALQASSRAQPGNIINDSAWAKVTLRLVPDMQPEKVAKLLKEFIRSKTPWGVEIHFKDMDCNGPWAIDPVGPAFEAAHRALQKGYGEAPLTIGCGGTIPFVKPIADALGGAPALLIGVEDPYTNAHGENESLLISDFKKACLSQVYLFEELAHYKNKNKNRK